MERIGWGAEATVDRIDDIARKTRAAKTYRHPQLDTKLRKFRTRREAKVLSKLPIPGPKLIAMDDKEMQIDMEFLDGKKVRDVLNENNAESLAKEIGSLFRQLHDAGIIHGDLTTSNMLYVDEKIHFIDFGLSFFSETIEDKAVDLHLLKHALHATHPHLTIWETVLESYSPDEKLKKRFDEVELRGRYKHKH